MGLWTEQDPYGNAKEKTWGRRLEEAERDERESKRGKREENMKEAEGKGNKGVRKLRHTSLFALWGPSLFPFDGLDKTFFFKVTSLPEVRWQRWDYVKWETSVWALGIPPVLLSFSSCLRESPWPELEWLCAHPASHSARLTVIQAMTSPSPLWLHRHTCWAFLSREDLKHVAEGGQCERCWVWTYFFDKSSIPPVSWGLLKWCWGCRAPLLSELWQDGVPFWFILSTEDLDASPELIWTHSVLLPDKISVWNWTDESAWLTPGRLTFPFHHPSR